MMCSALIHNEVSLPHKNYVSTYGWLHVCVCICIYICTHTHAHTFAYTKHMQEIKHDPISHPHNNERMKHGGLAEL